MRSDHQSQLTGVLVGGGVMGSLHLRLLHSLPRVGEILLVEPDAERGATLAAAYPGTRHVLELDEALAERPAFAGVAVPVGAAPAVAKRMLAAGVPTLLEKPMAPSVEDARELVELAASRDVLLTIGYVERFNPAVRALREALLGGEAGTVHHAHSRRLSPYPNRTGMAGVATDLATHDLDVMRFVMGTDPVRIYAETANPKGGAGEDLLCASIRFASGSTGLIESNWISPTKVRQLTVTAERGMYVVDYLTQDLYLYEQAQSEPEWEALGVMRGANEGRMIRYALHRREPLAVEWDAFLDAIVDGGPPPVTPEEGLLALTAAHAIIESGRTSQPIVFQEVGVG